MVCWYLLPWFMLMIMVYSECHLLVLLFCIIGEVNVLQCAYTIMYRNYVYEDDDGQYNIYISQCESATPSHLAQRGKKHWMVYPPQK